VTQRRQSAKPPPHQALGSTAGRARSSRLRPRCRSKSSSSRQQRPQPLVDGVAHGVDEDLRAALDLDVQRIAHGLVAEGGHAQGLGDQPDLEPAAAAARPASATVRLAPLTAM
jgi:hypothetical protein